MLLAPFRLRLRQSVGAEPALDTTELWFHQTLNSLTHTLANNQILQAACPLCHQPTTFKYTSNQAIKLARKEANKQ